MNTDKYTINVNQHFDFDLTTADLSDLDIKQTADGDYHLLRDQKAYHIKVVAVDYAKKEFNLSVNGQPYQITIADQFDMLVEKMGLSVIATKKINEVRAPMPGLVLEISVEVGQEIKTGDGLLILEAMKMENVIKSAGEGIIKAINAEKGQAVEKGTVLIELE